MEMQGTAVYSADTEMQGLKQSVMFGSTIKQECVTVISG